MKKVMVFGTFDIFHPGHRNFLKQAKKYGDYLIVVIARDETVLKVKNKKTVNNEKNRLHNISKSGLANKVVLGNLDNKYLIIKKYKPDIICLGYDQKFFIDGLANFLIKSNLKGVCIKKLKSYYPKIYKSSILLKNIKENH